jgi:hypothetical protein
MGKFIPATIVLATALALAGAPVPGQTAEPASYQDLRDLEYELQNLDESLRNVDTRDPRHRDLQERVDRLRDDVTRLERQIREYRESSGEGTGATRDEVSRLRREASTLQRDITRSVSITADPRPAAAELPGDARVPQGTEIEASLERPVSSATARTEDRVSATVSTPVSVDGRVVIPAGTRVEGVVHAAEPAQRPSKGGRVELQFDHLVVDNQRVPIDARLVSLEGADFSRSTAERGGIGAIIGGVLGSLVGGGKGAVVGAIVGGAGGVAATEGKEVELPVGSVLRLRLERDVAVADNLLR